MHGKTIIHCATVKKNVKHELTTRITTVIVQSFNAISFLDGFIVKKKKP